MESEPDDEYGGAEERRDYTRCQQLGDDEWCAFNRPPDLPYLLCIVVAGGAVYEEKEDIVALVARAGETCST